MTSRRITTMPRAVALGAHAGRSRWRAARTGEQRRPRGCARRRACVCPREPHALGGQAGQVGHDARVIGGVESQLVCHEEDEIWLRGARRRGLCACRRICGGTRFSAYASRLGALRRAGGRKDGSRCDRSQCQHGRVVPPRAPHIGLKPRRRDNNFEMKYSMPG